tara:strand:+ start:184 stop:627 length:444 start_codon:yes stop_codon:yes gene_type:complete
MKKLLFYRFIFITFLSAAILVGGYIVYMWYTYIDDTSVTGSAYGLNIGDSKYEVYGDLPLALTGLSEFGRTFIEIKVDKATEVTLATNSDYTVFAQTLLHDIGYEKFKSLDSWEFYVNASYFNSLKLKFCEDKLCEIHRHRKYFELP